MTTYQVDVLNPKADKLLKDLADMDLIALKPAERTGFLQTVERLRAKASANPLTLADITKEVELVRKKRYARSKA